ncbi:MAG: ABC transporter ATP-binding protein [Clostridiales bacterium]|nr:ABC transporter ATP-binding protein [Clostridiales bacterium]
MKNKVKKEFNYFGYLRKYKTQSFFAPFCKGVETLSELFVPYIMAKIIDIGIAHNDVGYIIRNGILILALNIIGIIFAIIGQKCAAIASRGAGKDIRNDIFEHINDLSHSELDKFSTTTLLNRSVNDVRNIQVGLGSILRVIMRAPVLIIGSLIMSLFINIKLSLVFVVIIPLLVLIVWKVMSKLKPLLLTIKTKLDKTTNVTRENLTGVRVVRAFNKQNYETEKFKNANYDLISTQIKHGEWNSALSPLISMVVNLAVLLLFYFGGIEVNVGGLSQGKLIAFIDYFGTISVCIVTLANLITIITRMNASAVRINELMTVKNSIKNPSNPTKVDFDDINLGKVEFKDVNFSYSSVKNAVTDLSFKAEPGEIIGIIGGTGSGKSSIINLIPRFYDVTSGEILVNDVNIKKYNIEDLRNIIGLVPQNPTLFEGTIRSNMCWRKQDATDEEIIKALKIAQAYDFVKEYPDFLEHKVNKGGKNFSGGQRQRLTIARGLIGNPHIIILDDSSSALDFATDAKLRKSIRNNLTESTVFIVTQRTNSIRDANKIIVVNNGNIIDIGTHTELLERCQIYQEIHYSQNKKETK